MVGFKIPDTIVSKNLDDVTLKLKKYDEVLTTSIQETIFAFNDNNALLEFQSTIVKSKDLTGDYFPSLFQENIIKQYEVRVFVLRDRFFGIGMYLPFSSNQSIDFRNNVESLRYFKIDLPQIVKLRTIEFMSKMGINTGSFDFVVNENNDYLFLEVNPTGQFDWVSLYGQFNIEKEIALVLKSEYEKRI